MTSVPFSGEISRDDGVARWRRVADDLRARIADGLIVDLVPPETELAARYGVNRHTVRRAIAALAAEGALRAERGRGTFVNRRPQRIVYPIGSRTRFSENMLKQSLEPAGRLIRSEVVPATHTLAQALRCGQGASLHRLDRLSVVDGAPLSCSTSYFTLERFPSIIEAYAETGSISQALARCGVMDYRRSRTEVTAERVSQNDAALLNCPPDAIVLVSQAVDVDMTGEPVQFIRTKFLADRVKLVVDHPGGLQ